MYDEYDDGFDYLVFDECRNDKHPDDHWYRTPLCQKILTVGHSDREPVTPYVCNDDDWVFEHNDIDNPDENWRKHTLVPGDPLTDANTRRRNDCRGYIDAGYWTIPESERSRSKQCTCQCHWGQYYVNVYEIDRNYGGPEEGGWWYGSGVPIASTPFDTLREAESFEEAMEARFPHTGKVNSVIYSGGDYSVRIERRFAEPYPDKRPHYE